MPLILFPEGCENVPEYATDHGTYWEYVEAPTGDIIRVFKRNCTIVRIPFESPVNQDPNRVLPTTPSPSFDFLDAL